MPGCSTSPGPALRDRQPRFQPALVQCLQHALDDRQVVAVGGPHAAARWPRAQIRQQAVEHPCVVQPMPSKPRALQPTRPGPAAAVPAPRTDWSCPPPSGTSAPGDRLPPEARAGNPRSRRASPPGPAARSAPAGGCGCGCPGRGRGAGSPAPAPAAPARARPPGKGGMGLVAVQQVEHGTGFRARTVINGQPDAVADIRQPAQHRRIEATVGQEHRHHEQCVAGHHQRQPPVPARQGPDQDHQQLRRHQPGQPAPGPGRNAMQCSCVAHPP